MKPQATLGYLISRLERCEPNEGVFFDFGRLSPKPRSLDSYRGFYDHLAVDFVKAEYDHEIKVVDFLKELRECLGKTFTGYKGGDYTMHEGTPLWVAPYGGTCDTAIIDVIEDYRVVLETRFQS